MSLLSYNHANEKCKEYKSGQQRTTINNNQTQAPRSSLYITHIHSRVYMRMESNISIYVSIE